MTVGVTSPRAAPPTEVVARCELCGDTGVETVLAGARDRLHRLPGEFTFVRCTGCGLVRLSPRPRIDEIGFYYPDDYGHYHRAGSERSAPAPTAESGDGARAGLLRRVRTEIHHAVLAEAGYHPRTDVAAPLRRLAPWFARRLWMRTFFDWPGFPVADPAPGRALDVGCGSGTYLRLLQHFGWDVAGVELSPEPAEIARRTTGAEVFTGQLEAAPFAPESFDHVHMSHVVEHVPEPVTSLEAAWKLLRPGGVLYVETPNAEASTRRRTGEFWFPYETPRHLHLFSVATLTRALERAGFTTERVKPRRFSHVHAWEDTYRREDAAGAVLDGHRPAPVRPSRRPRAAALAVPAWLANLRASRGDLLCCWARKPSDGAA